VQLARVETLPMPFPDIVSFPIELLLYFAFLAALDPGLKWWGFGLAIPTLLGMRLAISSAVALALQLQQGQSFAQWFHQVESSLAIRGVALAFVIVACLPLRRLFSQPEELLMTTPAAPAPSKVLGAGVERQEVEPGFSLEDRKPEGKLFEGVELKGKFAIPARALASSLPPEYVGTEAERLASREEEVELPLALVTGQLPRGRLSVALSSLAASLPRNFLTRVPDDVFVDLPLDIVVSRLPQEAFVAPEWLPSEWLKLFVDSEMKLFSLK
jgi:hypothetical protein